MSNSLTDSLSPAAATTTMATASSTPENNGSNAAIAIGVAMGILLLFLIVVAAIITVCVLTRCLIKRKRNIDVTATELTDRLDFLSWTLMKFLDFNEILDVIYVCRSGMMYEAQPNDYVRHLNGIIYNFFCINLSNCNQS